VRELALLQRLHDRLRQRVIDADEKYGDEGLQYGLVRGYWEAVDEVIDAVARLAFMLPLMDDVPRMRIYVAGPYTAPTPQEKRANIRRAREAAAEIYRRGHVPFCPHSMTAGFEHDFPDIDADVYLDTDLVWLRLCHGILMLPGWEQSNGAQIEHSVAKRSCLRIFYSLEEIPPRGDGDGNEG